MKVVTSREVSQDSINRAIKKLRDELEANQKRSKLWREMPTIEAYERHLIEKIAILDTVVLDEFGTNEPARDILHTMGFMPLCQCDECGSVLRVRFVEFSIDEGVFRVCFVCLQDAYAAASKVDLI